MADDRTPPPTRPFSFTVSLNGGGPSRRGAPTMPAETPFSTQLSATTDPSSLGLGVQNQDEVTAGALSQLNPAGKRFYCSCHPSAPRSRPECSHHQHGNSVFFSVFFRLSSKSRPAWPERIAPAASIGDSCGGRPHELAPQRLAT